MKRLLTFCFTLFFTFSLCAKNFFSTDEASQNAAASLTYYLEQLCLSLSDEQNAPFESVSFSEDEVMELWQTVESFCCRETSQTYAQSISNAFHHFRHIDFKQPKEEIFLDLFPCFLEVHSLWLTSINEDAVEASLEALTDLTEESKAFLNQKKYLLTMHACNQIQNKLATTIHDGEKNKLLNLLNWVSTSGMDASEGKWQKWKNYYNSSEKDPLKAALKFSAHYNDFQKNPKLSSSARKKLMPYLLPKKHAVKSHLDKIFLHARATQNPQSLSDANFQVISVQGRSFIHVLAHPSFPHYLLKVVLDNELRKKRSKPEWEWFARRCEYAKKVADLIDKHHIKSFTVPKKWVYPLPLKPSPPSSSAYKQKPVALVVQKMNLVPYQETLDTWRNQIGQEQLKELYTIVSRLSKVSIRPDNLPLTTSGKFAFVDTEYVRGSPSYGFIRPYLSKEMRVYWDRLVSKGGK